jgi:protein-tyrosine phosphatase
MHYILHNLAIGDFRDALETPGEISALLNVAEEKDIYDTAILYHKIPIVDMRPIPPGQMAEAVAWISEHSSAYRILVFCNAGVGRSPSIAIAYLCCALGFGFGEAVEYVARVNPDITILPGLIRSIQQVSSGHFVPE